MPSEAWSSPILPEDDGQILGAWRSSIDLVLLFTSGHWRPRHQHEGNFNRDDKCVFNSFEKEG